MKQKKKLILICILIFTITLTVNNCKNNHPHPRPNIVIIIIDALRPDHLPCYNYHKNTAPFICSLTKKGTLFTNAFSTSSWTAPSVASLFTSFYPFQHNLITGLAAQKKLIEKNNRITITSLNNEIITLPELLKKIGYQTFSVSANPNISEVMGLHQGFDNLIIPKGKAANNITKFAIGLKKNIIPNKPYFLYIHFMDTHSPYKIKIPHYLASNNAQDNHINIYDLEINFVDKHIKKLFNEYKWNNNTLLIIAADHGEELYDHNKTGHGFSLYKEVIKIPLIIYYPTRIPQNEKINYNASLLDIFPTITNILNIKSTSTPSGKSLLPLILNKNKHNNTRYLFSHLKPPKYQSKSEEIISVLYKDYHYIQYPKNKLLFDLSLDPNEKNNIIKHKNVLANSMLLQYQIYLKKSIKYPPLYKTTSLNQEQIQLLKSLGYIK